jgi:hypothetical protein
MLLLRRGLPPDPSGHNAGGGVVGLSVVEVDSVPDIQVCFCFLIGTISWLFVG